MISATFDSARRICGYSAETDTPLAKITEDGFVIPSSAFSYTVKDIAIDGENLALTMPCKRVSVAGASGYHGQNDSLATVDASGLVTPRVPSGGGSVGVLVEHPRGDRLVRVDIDAVSAQQTQSWVSAYVAGTLAHHVYDQLSALVVGKVAGVDTCAQFSSVVHDVSAPVAVRNPALFCGGLDFSATTLCRGSRPDDGAFPGQLVSVRHVISANHVSLHVGESITFLRADGSTQTAKVLAVTQPEIVAGTPVTDCSLAYLDQDVTGVTPYRVLPANWRHYLPCVGSRQGGPMFLPVLSRTMHFGTSHWAEYFHIQFTPSLGGQMRLGGDVSRGILEKFVEWESEIITGDSGSPSFLVINGAPVLLGTQYSPVLGGGISDYAAQINQAMNNLSGSIGVYALSEVDLSGFTYFD